MKKKAWVVAIFLILIPLTRAQSQTHRAAVDVSEGALSDLGALPESNVIATFENHENIQLGFWPYNRVSLVEPNHISARDWLNRKAEEAKARKFNYVMMNIFTVGGTLTWVHAMPGGAEKKVALVLFHTALQHLLFFNPNFFNQSVDWQVSKMNALLKAIGSKRVLDSWDVVPRSGTVFTTALSLGIFSRLVNNYDQLMLHMTSRAQYAHDALIAAGWVFNNFPWDYFSAKIDGGKYPQVRRFFNFYDQVRWVAVALVVMGSYKASGEVAALSFLFTHGLIGVLAKVKSEKVLDYLESKKIGDRLEGMIENIQLQRDRVKGLFRLSPRTCVQSFATSF